MSEFFEELGRIGRTERRVVVATLVDTHGTTPRKEGARMWVGEDGRVLGSVTIGGCVDAQVLTEAEAVLTDARPRLLAVDLGDEDAWEIGLTCGGTVEVFVEPLGTGAGAAGASGALALYEMLRARLGAGGGGVVVTRLDPPGAGAKLLQLDDGRRAGTLGDAALDEAAAALAGPTLSAGASRTVRLEPGVRVFVEAHAPSATLLVVGATHVAMPLVALARPLGYRTVVVDARPRFATRDRFPDVDELVVGIPSDSIRRFPLGAATALVLVAHDYKYDLPVLRQALTSPVGYVGLLGSRRRGEAILGMLREDGVSEATLGRVRVPIGLDLGGRSAPEIALAILAEVVAVRHGGSGRPLGEVRRARPAEPTT